MEAYPPLKVLKVRTLIRVQAAARVQPISVVPSISTRATSMEVVWAEESAMVLGAAASVQNPIICLTNRTTRVSKAASVRVGADATKRTRTYPL